MRIENYEELCDWCNGNRIIFIKGLYREKSGEGSIICPNCKGCGKIDWIDKIKEKKNWKKEMYIKMNSLKIHKAIMNNSGQWEVKS